MGSIWKAVTGFFKGSNSTTTSSSQAEEEMEATTSNSINRPEEETNNQGGSDSDSDDEDFVPNEANDGAESEEASEDPENGDNSPSQKRKTDRTKSGKKRKVPSAKSRKRVNGARSSKRRKFDKDSDDDSEDLDFTVNESLGEEDETEEVKITPEQQAAQEAAEKAETDKLWAAFLSSVDEEKERRRKKGLERTVEKVVTKTVDFAGEKVSVQETVKVTVSGANGENGAQDSPSSSVSTVALSDVSNSNASSSTAEPAPGGAVNGESSKGSGKVGQRRGGISILGNDPETIGLDDLEKRGLSGLLKAFQNKADAAQARRIGTLEKSKLDWDQYKRARGLEEELTHHNKSRDTYIDKQEFLQRSDYRQFEIERSMRATQRSKRLAN